MLQIGNCQNNHLIINGFLKIRHRGSDKFSAFYYFCNPKQRENELTRTLRHFALQIGSEKLKFSTLNKSFIKGLTNFALAG